MSIASNGTGIGGVGDGLTFTFRPIRGNAVVIAKVTGFLNAGTQAQAAVMIRESLASNARHATLLVTPAGSTAFQRRTTVGSAPLVTTRSGKAPLWLKLERRNAYLIASQSLDGLTWTTVGSTSMTMTETLFIGLGVASKSTLRTTAAFARVMVVGDGELESGYSAVDLGAPSLKGGSWSGGGSAILDAAGTGTEGVLDQARFVYKIVDGDADVVARVTSLDIAPRTARAGLMMRTKLGGGAPALALMVGPADLIFTSRTAASTPTQRLATVAKVSPVWLRMSRRGAQITASRSNDGVTWTAVGTYSQPSVEPLYVGFAAVSGAAEVRVRALLDKTAVLTNKAPTVQLTSPASAGGIVPSYFAPATVSMTASATDADGSITKVEFYQGTTLLGTDTTAPYAFNWVSVTAGAYSLTAVAQDNRGARSASVAVPVAVNAVSVVPPVPTAPSTQNGAPFVSLLSPVSGATFQLPASVAMTASASDTDGSVTKVSFYAGSQLLGSDSTSPYAFTWSAVPEGKHAITAVAYDNAGSMTVSSAREVIVTRSALPRIAIFTPATSHETVDRYVLEIFRAASDPRTAIPMTIRDIGRPAVVDNEIRVDVGEMIYALPAGNYIASVVAASADGTLRSAASPVFTR